MLVPPYLHLNFKKQVGIMYLNKGDDFFFRDHYYARLSLNTTKHLRLFITQITEKNLNRLTHAIQACKDHSKIKTELTP